MTLYISRVLHNLENTFSDIISFLTFSATQWTSNSYPELEDEETSLEWLNEEPKVTELLDGKLTCEVDKKVRHSLRHFICKVQR